MFLMFVSPCVCLSNGIQNILMCNSYGINKWAWGGSEGVNTLLQPVVILSIQSLSAIIALVNLENTNIQRWLSPIGRCMNSCFRVVCPPKNSKKGTVVGSGSGISRDEEADGERLLLPGARTKLVNSEDNVDVEDEDVRAERAEIDNGGDVLNSRHTDIENRGEDSAISMIHLKKRFWPKADEIEGTLAVSDLCLRIRVGECFALLGTNGVSC